MKLLLRTILFLMIGLMANSPAWANGADFTDSLGYFRGPTWQCRYRIVKSRQAAGCHRYHTHRRIYAERASSNSWVCVDRQRQRGDTTWSSAGGVSGWTVSGSNVYETAGGNVGIGTTFLTTAALTVMNGNVGIGTWVAAPQNPKTPKPQNPKTPILCIYLFYFSKAYKYI